MANFTTTQKVRDESWFTNNPNIADSSIAQYADRANGIVLSYVWARYLITALTGAGFRGSQAEKFLVWVETRLAAAYLLQKEYWEDSLDSDKDWYRKEEEAESDLERIMRWEIRLLKVDWTEFDRAAERKDPIKDIWDGLKSVTTDKFFSVNDEF